MVSDMECDIRKHSPLMECRIGSVSVLASFGLSEGMSRRPPLWGQACSLQRVTVYTIKLATKESTTSHRRGHRVYGVGWVNVAQVASGRRCCIAVDVGVKLNMRSGRVQDVQTPAAVKWKAHLALCRKLEG